MAENGPASRYSTDRTDVRQGGSVTNSAGDLRQDLRSVGLSTPAIDAVWPGWWSDEADESASARAQLRLELAQRFGIDPETLFEGPPRFVWEDALFKNLGDVTPRELIALSSFGSAVGRALWAQSGESADLPTSPLPLREAILRNHAFVTLEGLLQACWGLRIPVVHLMVFPLREKRMHAMAVRAPRRAAILLGRKTAFAAQAAFYVAHELGHVALGHGASHSSVVDVGDPLAAENRDDDERAADAYALELLTGRPEIIVDPGTNQFNARSLADAVVRQTQSGDQVDPAVFALCAGHTTGRWDATFGALKLLPPGEQDVTGYVNAVAERQLSLGAADWSAQEYLGAALGLA